MEWKIGEIKQVNGEWYQCIESSSCPKCDLKWLHNCNIQYPCSVLSRKDGNEVIFKKLEKVREPVTERGRTFQCLNAFKTECTGCVFLNSERGCDKVYYIDDPCPNMEIWVEIKQNKEDMEDNRTIFPKENNTLTRIVDAYVNGKILDKELIRSIKEMSDEYPYNKNNLKPFDLEAAKAGKPVCTRDGKKARIICFDKKDCKRIVALVQVNNETEVLHGYYNDGSVFHSDSDNDLMMLPEKKKGWILLRKDGCVFDNEEVAKKNCTNNYFVAKVEWEE